MSNIFFKIFYLKSALKSFSHFDVKIVSFDYHAEVKQSKENLRFLDLEEFNFCQNLPHSNYLSTEDLRFFFEFFKI